MFNGKTAAMLGLLAACQLAASASMADMKASATEIMAPGNRIADYRTLRFEQNADYIVQRLSERTYWIAVDEYSMTLYVGDQGALLFDTAWAGYELRLLQAVKSITDKPITAVVYSHSHLDHIGGAAAVVEASKAQGVSPRIIASDKTAMMIERFGLSVPRPTDVLSSPLGQFSFEGLQVRMHTPEIFAHSIGTSVIELVGERVVHAADVVAPEELPFMSFSYPADMRALVEVLEFTLSLDWDFMNAGHWNLGLKKDVQDTLSFIADMKAAALVALQQIPRADHYTEGKHPNKALMDHADALTASIHEQLAPKYGHYSYFESTLPSYMKVVVNEIILNNDG